jgi:hypothetical protein
MNTYLNDFNSNQQRINKLIGGDKKHLRHKR